VNGGKLTKWKFDNNKDTIQRNDMLSGYSVTLYNTHTPNAIFENYHINYGWYRHQCTKVIESITPSQLKIFNF
jgi:hypothetical protein